MSKKFDLLIKGGEIIDGTGTAGIIADLGISNGKITGIGDLAQAEAKDCIDAKGLIVTPGFIDMHTHQEWGVFADAVDPSLVDDSKIMQGVTTDVCGNCGNSGAPVTKEHLPELKKYLGAPDSFPWSWESFADLLNVLESKKPLTNIVPLVGHGTLRIAAMGFAKRKPTDSEMDVMKELLAQSLADGAFGMSTGLIYPPGVFAETDELIELCKIVASKDCLYASHIRNESDQVLEAVQEGIEIAEKAAVKFQLSHHKVAGRANWGKSRQTLAMIDAANAKGLNVTCDAYPYRAGGTVMSALLPPWTLEGGTGAMLERLRDKATRQRIAADLNRGLPGWENYCQTVGWDNLRVGGTRVQTQYEGLTLTQLAEQKNMDAPDAFMDLLLAEEGLVSMTMFQLAEDDIKDIILHQAVMIGSDSTFYLPHPRQYGTFPRVIAKYVRDEKLLSLPAAIHKMTGMTANKLGLRDRGTIKTGLCADIVLFDFNKIQDKATYLNPKAYPDGVVYVVINGEIAVRGGKYTGVRAGKVLRKQRV